MATTTEYLTTPEAARRLGVTPATLRRWAKNGAIRHVLLPSGIMRFSTADLDAVLQPRGTNPYDQAAGVA